MCKECLEIMDGGIPAVRDALGLIARLAIKVGPIHFGLGQFEAESLARIAAGAHGARHGHA